MELYFLRHGIAVERGTPGYKDDSARPLTPKGRRQLKKISTALRRMELEFDLILSSPLVRAKGKRRKWWPSAINSSKRSFTPKL